MSQPLNRRTLMLAALSAAILSACSKGQDAPPASPQAARPSAPTITPASYDLVAAQAKGFTVGAMMSANAVYVLFDPQCPHCGHLWQASQPLLDRVKFIWVPVAFNQGKSLSQAAALLSASDPAKTMTDHENALLAGQGGLAASNDVPDAMKATMKANTDILNQLGVDSVPFIMAKHRRNGTLIAQSGAMPTAELSALLGVD